MLAHAGCVIHHGGFGTTAATFRAGVPSIVIPHILDQFLWGNKVFELGVGPKPIPRKGLTSANLGLAILEIKENKSMNSSADSLGRLIRSENGVQNAVRMINNVIL